MQTKSRDKMKQGNESTPLGADESADDNAETGQSPRLVTGDH